MKKISILFTAALVIIALSASASQAQDQWAKTYGGDKMDGAFSLEDTVDGSYIWAGFSASFNGSTTNDYNAWVGKLDGIGDLIWEKEYGGSKYDWVSCIRETIAEGYIAAGYTESFGSGGADAWVLKLNADGTIAWEKAYGGIYSDEATYVSELSGGGYIVAGRASSFGVGDSDMWVLRLDGSGVVQWQRRYGGSDFDRASCIRETSDPGGYIMAGDTWVVASGQNGDSDIAVLKLESNGDVTWQNTYGGGIDDDMVSDIQQTSDGGYVVAGATRSFDGISKAWVLKLTSLGAITWQKTYGDTSITAWSYATSIKETSGGGYIVGGYTYDYGAGWSDSWLLALDSSGGITWQKTYGGSNAERTYVVEETTAGEYIMAGTTYSFGGGESDVWIVDADSNGDIPECAIVGTSAAVASDTTVAAEDGDLDIYVTTGTTTVTAASVNNTSADISTVCPISACPLCQEYQAKYQTCESLCNAGRNLDYDECKGYLGQTSCEGANCYWNADKNACIIDLCLMDGSFDGKVNNTDFGILKKEFSRIDCVSGSGSGSLCELCNGYEGQYQACESLCALGRNLDYDACKLYVDQTSCEGADCYWNADKNACMIDLCLMDGSLDGKVNNTDFGILKKEFSRIDCAQ